MPTKCPPGVICIENMTLTLATILFLAIIAFIYYKHPNTNTNTNTNPVSSKNIINYTLDILNKQQLSNTNNPQTLVQTPHREIGIPVNIKTQAGGYNSTYEQVGILTGNNEILPLMGKQLITKRDTWNFHTISNQRNQIRLPISHKGKSCTNEYGCDNLYTGDTVYVEGYNSAFKVTMYEKNNLQYIPII